MRFLLIIYSFRLYDLYLIEKDILCQIKIVFNKRFFKLLSVNQEEDCPPKNYLRWHYEKK
jgi:hypothetical protein